MGSSNNLTVGGATATISSDLGYIKDGITTTPTVELFTIDGIEQLLTPARAWRTSERFECALTLCEPTQGNIKIGWDVDNSWSGSPPTLSFGDNQFAPQSNALVVTGYTCGATQYVRTITFHKAIVSTPGPLKFSKGEETNLAIVFMCLYDDVTNNRVGTISDATS